MRRRATHMSCAHKPIRATPPGAGPRPRASRATPPVPHGNGRGRRRRGRSRHAGNSKVTPRQYRVRCTSVSGKDTETLRTRLSRGGGPTGHRDSRQRHVSLRSCSRLAGCFEDEVPPTFGIKVTRLEKQSTTIRRNSAQFPKCENLTSLELFMESLKTYMCNTLIK